MGYTLGMLLAFVEPWVSIVLYIAIAIAWFIPDRRIERRLPEESGR
jgi:hypothetical protein